MSADIEQIQHAIETILRTYLGTDKDLGPNTNLTSDLDLASVQIMEFVVEIEDHFDIAIDLESLSNIHTLAELAQTVARSL